MDYQWYPGHMTKARRMMQENVRLVDLVIEILDARVPMSSRNPDINQLAQGKQRLIIMSKADLADPKMTERFVKQFEKDGASVIALDARTKKANNQIMKSLQKITKEKKERDKKRGIIVRPVRAMICGIPNVGKSTFINSLSGRSSAKTGNKPGVTKGKQWISFAGLELLDTPGILWPKFEDQQVGVRLALVGSIRDEILDEEELARKLLAFMVQTYPELLQARYGMARPKAGGESESSNEFTNEFINESSNESMNESLKESAERSTEEFKDELLQAMELAKESGYNDRQLHEILVIIAARRNLLRSGGEADPRRAAHLLMDDFRSGRLGAITLDTPEA